MHAFRQCGYENSYSTNTTFYRSIKRIFLFLQKKIVIDESGRGRDKIEENLWNRPFL